MTAFDVKYSGATVDIPAGRYILGDPCYTVVSQDDWFGLLKSCDFFKQPVGHLPSGRPVVAFSTAYGDGVYVDNERRSYPVDSGLIGLVPVPECFVHPNEGEGVYTVIFERDTTASTDGDGVLTFGNIKIDTSDDVEGAEYEYYEDETDEEEDDA